MCCNFSQQLSSKCFALNNKNIKFRPISIIKLHLCHITISSYRMRKQENLMLRLTMVSQPLPPPPLHPQFYPLFLSDHNDKEQQFSFTVVLVCNKHYVAHFIFTIFLSISFPNESGVKVRG